MIPRFSRYNDTLIHWYICNELSNISDTCQHHHSELLSRWLHLEAPQTHAQQVQWRDTLFHPPPPKKKKKNSKNCHPQSALSWNNNDIKKKFWKAARMTLIIGEGNQRPFIKLMIPLCNWHTVHGGRISLFFSSWWLNHPFENYNMSNWIISPWTGVKINNHRNHHVVFLFGAAVGLRCWIGFPANPAMLWRNGPRLFKPTTYFNIFNL